MTAAADVALWKAAAVDPRVSEVLSAIFSDATEVVRRERPLCLASGRCCRFEAHGHRLYVTGLEAAWFLRALLETRGRTLQSSEIESAQARGDCPMLEDGLCSVHEIRPFGCRGYFCDPRARWQEATYERWHQQVRALHDELELPYAYGEWRTMLASLVVDRLPD